MTDFIQVINCGSLEEVLQPFTAEDALNPMILSKGERLSHGEVDCSKRQSPDGEFDQVLAMLVIFAEQPKLAFMPVHSVMVCLVGEEHCKFWKNPGQQRLENANRIVETT